tara:strand:- start:17403 stop:18926 length:1524 start_codon:yes stop_codon:yes gene_type:complete
MNNILMKSQAYELDEMAMVRFGIPSKNLMSEAGRNISKFIKYNIKNIKSVGIVAGKGNNGGDGFATAFFLNKLDYNVTVYSINSIDSLKPDSLYYYKKCNKKNIPIIVDPKPPSKKTSFDLIIDSIIGIGFKGELKEDLKKWSRWINQNSLILSCDIPTGVNSDTGNISIDTVKADYTITMGYPKIGMFLEPGKSYSGLISSVDIGFPKNIDELSGIKWKLITDDHIKKIVKPLDRDTHKYNQGKVLILAGSQGMTGAAYLATLGALRSGCGITKTFAPSSLNNIYEKKITEGMTISCNDLGKGYFSKENYNQIVDSVDWADVVLIGPGLGKKIETIELLKKLYSTIDKPMVIDADGFGPFYNDKNLINQLKNKYILTPHVGELSKLFDVKSENIKEDIISYIEKMTSSKLGVLVVKNAPTLISDGNSGYINSSGNPGLASAGTGDVLSGMIASFISQGYNLIESTVIGVYIHGYAADIVSKKTSERGMIASDLLFEISNILSEYEL